MSNRLLFLLPITLGASVFLFQNCSGPTPSNFSTTKSNQSLPSQPAIGEASIDNETPEYPTGSRSYTQFPKGDAKSFFTTPSNINSGNQNSQNSPQPAPAPAPEIINPASISPGANCSYVTSLAGLGYGQLLSDYKAAFDGRFLKVGQTSSWASGTITRNVDGSLDYKNPANPADNFTMRIVDSPKRIALDHPLVHQLWIRQYGVQFGQSQIQIWGTANVLHHLFGYPMGPNKSFPIGSLNINVSTGSVAGNYTFHTPDGPMSTVQFLASNWCLAITSDWGQND